MNKEKSCDFFWVSVMRNNKTPVLAAKNRGLDRSMSQHTREYLATHCIEIIKEIYAKINQIRYFFSL